MIWKKIKEMIIYVLKFEYINLVLGSLFSEGRGLVKLILDIRRIFLKFYYKIWL